MIRFLGRRVLQAIVVLFIVTIIVFVLIHLLPGGPARAELGVQATPTAVESFNKQHGFDKSLPQQYLTWLGELFRGDLGYSYKENSTVLDLLKDRLPKTALLAGVSVAIAVLIAIPLGTLQAVRRNRLTDYLATAVTFVLYSTPSFWLSLILVLFFSVKLGFLPAQAPQGSIAAVLAQPSGLVLPIATIALISVALYSRYMRSSTIDNLTQDYVRTARAKGASTARVLFGHVLRNAISPILTLLGLSLPFILSGTLITERVFNFPGMGLLFYNAAVTQDYPVLLAVTLVVAIATVLGSVLADIGYALLDPRIRHAHG
ncbi:ABC transporter permease [Jatrophihabitans lederbergiae]|uniref:ABC transporter permease n=1 Tax=Jatrophihabitans lederbergiae TaxID=3075547 RepID=A0ABU2J9H4_9ACTN|nr:ABC transporter permease [Jatrophihabitans sp. DSM 44399]MDT0261640.1 ABC transporter permease [Jatrophihabitans sp. DSM 44399]